MDSVDKPIAAKYAYADHETTDEEQVRLGWEAGQSIGWDTSEMAEYDRLGQEYEPRMDADKRG